MFSSTSRLIAAALLSIAMAGFQAAPGYAQAPLETEWVAAQANKARARLSAGAQGGQDYILVEVELAPDWKTYWRNPGEAGLPPEFRWDGSENIARAEPLFPAPHRFLDKAGETLGYKDSVVFPVKLERAAADKPTTVAASILYGVCKEICIPAEAQFTLSLPVGKLPELSGDVLSAIPRDQAALKPGDPAIVKAQAILGGDDPRIELEVETRGSDDGVQPFLDVEGGVYVPSPEPGKDMGAGRKLFVAKLTSGVDVDQLKGRTIRATVTTPKGASTKVVSKMP